MKSIQEFALEHKEIVDMYYDFRTKTITLKTNFPAVPSNMDPMDYLYDCLKPYYSLLKDFGKYNRRECLNSNVHFLNLRSWTELASIYVLEDKSSMVLFKHNNGIINQIHLRNVNIAWEENKVIPEKDLLLVIEEEVVKEVLPIEKEEVVVIEEVLPFRKEEVVEEVLVLDKLKTKSGETIYTPPAFLKIKIPPESNFPHRKIIPHCLEPPKKIDRKQSFKKPVITNLIRHHPLNLVHNSNQPIRYG